MSNFLPSRGLCPHVTIVRPLDQKLTSKSYKSYKGLKLALILEPTSFTHFGKWLKNEEIEGEGSRGERGPFHLDIPFLILTTRLLRSEATLLSHTSLRCQSGVWGQSPQCRSPDSSGTVSTKSGSICCYGLYRDIFCPELPHRFGTVQDKSVTSRSPLLRSFSCWNAP